eukprot:GHUV01000539.1.p4 GENE.GHUV01000539.1~~GHUV01000539.1.p4  ORF type:complete len:157 (-),score=23.15 GHUV01000539.1:500-970(-)
MAIADDQHWYTRHSQASFGPSVVDVEQGLDHLLLHGRLGLNQQDLAPATEWYLYARKALFVCCHTAAASAVEEPAGARLRPFLLCLLLLWGCYRGGYRHIAVTCPCSDDWKGLARLWGLREGTAAVALEGGNAPIVVTLEWTTRGLLCWMPERTLL